MNVAVARFVPPIVRNVEIEISSCLFSFLKRRAGMAGSRDPVCGPRPIEKEGD